MTPKSAEWAEDLVDKFADTVIYLEQAETPYRAGARTEFHEARMAIVNALLRLSSERDEMVERLSGERAVALGASALGSDCTLTTAPLRPELLEAADKLADACAAALNWAEGGCSPFANTDIGNAYDAVDAYRAIRSLSKPQEGGER